MQQRGARHAGLEDDVLLALQTVVLSPVWPRLKLHVEPRTAAPDVISEAFLAVERDGHGLDVAVRLDRLHRGGALVEDQALTKLLLEAPGQGFLVLFSM